MASKINSEFNYRYLVIGDTPWEKIKTLQGFLEGRRATLPLEEAHKLKTQAKYLELENAKSIGALPHIILKLQAEIIEIEAHEATQQDAFQKTKEEVLLLERLLAELYEQVEHTRLPGYTDEQMFELNAANEFTVKIAKEIQAELIANGRPSAAKIGNAMSNPYTFEALKKIGFIPEEVQMLEGNADPLCISLTAVEDTKQLMQPGHQLQLL